MTSDYKSEAYKISSKLRSEESPMPRAASGG